MKLEAHRAEKALIKYKENDQAKAAIKLLLPPKARLDDKTSMRCTDFVYEAIREVNFAASLEANPRLLGSPKTKAALKKLIAALKRAQYAIDNLPVEIHNAFYDLNTSEHIQRAEQYLKLKPGPKKRSGRKQRMAIEQAAFLLSMYGHELTTTRKGKWDKLSAILFGKPDVTLQRHMAEYWKAEPERKRAAQDALAQMRWPRGVPKLFTK